MTASSKAKRKSNIKERRNRLRKARATSKTKSSEKKKTGAPKSCEEEKMAKNASSIVNFLKDTTQNFINKTKTIIPPPGEYEIQQLQKAEEELKIAQASQSQEDIEIATHNLESAKKEKEEFDKYQEANLKSPEDLLSYLNDLLKRQIAENLHNDIISDTISKIKMTKDNIKNTEDLENAGTEKSQISLESEDNDELSEVSDNMEVEEESLSESDNSLPNIPYQQQCYDQNTNILTQEDNQNNISDEELNEGQKTPVSSGSTSSPNFIQTKLNDMLKVISPQEKMKQIRLQAKKNASKVREHVKVQKTSMSKKSSEMTNSDTIKHSTSSKKDESICENVEIVNETSSYISPNKVSTNDNDSTYTPKENEQDIISDTSDHEQSISKSKQTKISIARTYSKYYSIKMKVDKANVPVQQLIKHLKSFYKQLQRIDPTMIVYAYDNEIPTEAILKPNDMPNDISVLKKFCTRHPI